MAHTFVTPPWIVREGVVVYFKSLGFNAMAEKARTMSDGQIAQLNESICQALSESDYNYDDEDD